MPLRHLFLDMNAFFASCEQQDNPQLRGRPVAVIPTDTDATSCIAASYEAKVFGIKTGTPVWEAKARCPGLVCILANHRRYVIMHHRILDALGSVLPIDRVMSIDEMACRLLGEDRKPEHATEIAQKIKAAIRARAGESMRCSIGIGPNTVLAKMAADMKKPDGLTVLTDAMLPDALHDLKLQDFPGIGPRMERRLHLHGIFTAKQLCALSRQSLSNVWGSKVLGGRWYHYLRGDEVVEPSTRRQTVSHSHVLPPNLRTDAGTYGVLVRLTHKAAARLRKINYWAGDVAVQVSYLDGPRESPSPWGGFRGSSWKASCHIPHCQDTPAILQAIAKLWRGRPKGRVPFRIGMVLADLKAARSATPSLFAEDRKAAEVSRAMDEVNAEFGASVIHYGAMHGYQSAAPTRTAFTHIPDFDRRVN